MDTPRPPSIFANHVLSQVIRHAFGEDIVIEPCDFLTLRVVFRRCGGEWGKIVEGDLVHLELLKQIVGVWGRMPGREKESDRLV
jgi:hypothetical protein